MKLNLNSKIFVGETLYESLVYGDGDSTQKLDSVKELEFYTYPDSNDLYIEDKAGNILMVEPDCGVDYISYAIKDVNDNYSYLAEEFETMVDAGKKAIRFLEYRNKKLTK